MLVVFAAGCGTGQRRGHAKETVDRDAAVLLGRTRPENRESQIVT